MSAHSRRSFLTTSAGVAAGAAIIGARTPSPAAAHGTPTPSPMPPADTDVPIDPTALRGTVVYVQDAATGGLLIMDGDGEQAVVDPSLTRAIARAAAKQG